MVIAAEEPAPAPAPTLMAQPQPGDAPAMQPGASQPVGQDDLLALAMKAEAQRLLIEADQAFTERRYSEAVRKYKLALSSARQYLSPDEMRQAENRIAEAEIAMRGSGNLSGSFTDQFDLVRQQTQAEFDNALAQAEQAMAAGDIARARELAAGAELTIARARQYFSQTELDGFARKRSDLSGRINSAEESRRLVDATDKTRQLDQDAQSRQRQVAKERDRRIHEALKRVRALQQEQKYDEALQVVDQVLFLDNNNPAGLLLKEIIGDIRIFRISDQLDARKERNIQRGNLENKEAYIPPVGIIVYPENWPTKTYQRSDSGSYLETPENRRALGLLERPIPAQFAGHSLAQVVEYVKANTGVNMDVDWPALATIGVEPQTPIHLELSGTPARVVLERALARACKDPASKAGFTVADGIVSIGTTETLNRFTVTQPYNVTDLMLLMDIPTYDDVPVLDLATVINNNNKNRSGPTPFDADGRKKTAKNERMSKEEKMHRLVALVENSIDPDGWRERGGNTGAIQELNGNLIITTTPANHREITGLLSKLRELKSMQINVESRFLTVNQDFFEQIGFDIDLYFNTGSSQVTAAQANDPTILPGDFFDFRSPFGVNDAGSPIGPVRRDITGFPTTAGTSPPGTADDSRIRQGTVNPNRFSPIGFGQNSLSTTESLASGFSPFASSVLGAAPALGVAGQFLDDIQVDFLIKATQADRRSTTLTAPRLTLTNGQTANVVVGVQRSFISDLQPVTGDSAVGFDPQTGVVTDGVTLLVEAVVSSDRRYVTLNIDTSTSQSERPFRQVAVTAIAGGQLVNSADTASFIELPTIAATRVQTTVTVPDEGTVLLGGQRLITEIEVETGVPVLSKLPIINRFFTNRVQAKTEQTLLILVKPTILIQTEEEERNFPGLNDAVRSGALGG